MGDTLMAYGTLLTDAVQSSTANTPPQFNDGNGTQVGTLCRAWVNFNGVTTATIRASFNVSSVTRNGTGSYTVNFTNALSDANYAANISSSISSGGLGSQGGLPMELLAGASTLSRTASAFPFLTLNSTYGMSDAFSISVSIFR